MRFKAHRTSEEIRRLFECEAQVRNAKLGQPSPRAQPRERQRRARAAGDDQVHRRRRVVEQKGEGVVDGLRAYGVVVVEHEDEVAGQLQDLVAESGEDGLELLPRLLRSPGKPA